MPSPVVAALFLASMHSSIKTGIRVVAVLILLYAYHPSALSQRIPNPLSGTTPTAIPWVNVGGGPSDAQFFSTDFAQMVLDGQNRDGQKERERRQKLVASGTVSALDLAAPTKAVNEFNQASTLLRGQHSSEAIAHLQKAVAVYPNFVSAHDYLGLAYQDADDLARAQTEFETAVNLDPEFAASYVNLGRLALSRSNFSIAEEYLRKALALRPVDPAILTTLAYAQQGNREYSDAIQTVQRLHGLDHQGFGNAHYVAAVAAVSLTDYATAQNEFAVFLQEDPSNSLAPSAQHNIEVLQKNQQAIATAKAPANRQAASFATLPPTESLANSELLKTQLADAAQEPDGSPCTDCGETTTIAAATTGELSVPDATRATGGSAQFTIRKVVDEVAVFFGVTAGGRSVTGLSLNNIAVRDNGKPPERVLQFLPQSKLPLRIGLLIDTSGSVQPRFSFEKKAAAKFLQQMLINDADLAFVIGFADRPKTGADFTADQTKLAKAVDGLSNGGGTALFDAVLYSCWKLADYPERQRFAKVLVVLSDGEENSSHTSLRQTIRAIEATGVTVYTISTKEGQTVTTEADKVLKTLAERSGGEAFFPGDVPTLTKSFERLRDEIRSRYLVAYRPADFEPNGQYRTIAITAEKDGKHLQVHARKGYHARVESPTP